MGDEQYVIIDEKERRRLQTESIIRKGHSTLDSNSTLSYYIQLRTGNYHRMSVIIIII